MNWFRGTFNRRENAGTQKVGAELIRYVMQTLGNLELPWPETVTKTRLIRSQEEGRLRCRHFQVKAPYYLLVYASESSREAVNLNAGYVLGQAAMLFGLRGIRTRIFQQIPEDFIQEEGACAVAALAVGVDRRGQIPEASGRRDGAERPLIFPEVREEWIDDVLDYAGRFLTPECQTGVRMVRKENVIHFAAGKHFGRSRELTEFHAGIMLASVMVAAEELWLELCMVRAAKAVQEADAGPDYLISVCQKKDQSKYASGLLLSQLRPGEKERVVRAETGHRWKYA